MIILELKQSDKTFIHAGRLAYTMGIFKTENPYRTSSRLSKLWAVGYKQAKQEDDRKRLPNGRHVMYSEPIVENPYCYKCNLPIVGQPESLESYCFRCGDIYKHTEFELEEYGKAKRASNRQK